MKKLVRKMMSVLLIMGLLIAMIPFTDMGQVHAASKGKVKSIKVTNLPSKTLTLKKGKTKKLKVKITVSGKVSKKLKYSSSNKKVATVSSKGVIKAKKKGKAKITIASKAQPKKKTVITVTVGTPVKSVKLNEKSITLTAGESVKLKASVSPKKASNRKVVWQTSDKSVVKVSKKGQITALESGDAVITAVAADGSGKKAECAVTVASVGYIVKFESNGGTAVKSQNVKKGECALWPDEPSKGKAIFAGWYTDTRLSNEYDFVTPVTKNLTLYAKWDADTDEDGLSNTDETENHMTDPDKQDTDGDGFTDFEEVHLMGTDPLGYNDGDNDTDYDGLTDSEEISIGTDINMEDTDKDGLTDYDEVRYYSTDPLSEDSDGDSLSDSFELNNGLDPLSAKTNEGVSDADVEIYQVLSSDAISAELIDGYNAAVPSLEGSIKGEIDKQVALTTGGDATIDDNRAVVGSSVQVDMDDPSNKDLTLRFSTEEYDTGCFAVAKVEDGEFTLLDTERDDYEVSAKIDGEGLYCTLDCEKLLSTLGIDLPSDKSDKSLIYQEGSSEKSAEARSNSNNSNTEARNAKVSKKKVSKLSGKISKAAADSGLKAVEGQADIVFVVDSTGSMGDEIDNVVNNIASFVDILSNDYNVNANFGLVDFKDIEEDGIDSTQIIRYSGSNWCTSPEAFSDLLSSLYVDGGGDDPETDIDALEMARRMNFRSSASKFVILLTDADYKTENRYGLTSLQEEAELLKADGIVTSVVTDPYYYSSYECLASETGGLIADIYSEDFGVELSSIIDMIGETTSEGEWVILKHGFRYVRLDAPPEYGSSTNSDGDAYPDYRELGDLVTVDLTKEIELVLRYRGLDPAKYSGQTSIEVYDASSDPSMDDSDNDGIIDSDDTAPWERGLKGGIIGAIKICSYGSGPSSFGNFNGHAFVSYTSFIDDKLTLYGIEVKSEDEIAKSDGDTRSDRPEYHEVNVSSGDHISIGGWAGWLPDELKGTWINNEYYLFHNDSKPDQRSLQKFIKESDVDKIERDSKSNSKWTELYNCSAYAVDMWNDATGDDLSARGILVFRNPASLSHNIEKRSGYEVGGEISAHWP